MKAKIVRVFVERGQEGLFYATSPDLKGLLVAEKTVDALWESVPATIKAMYAACDVNVEVCEAEKEADAKFTPWVALPQRREAATHL